MTNFNSIILTLLLISIGSFSYSQNTLGGSEKNYNDYHLLTDTIYTKVKIPTEKFKFSYFSIGPSFANGTGKSLPSDFWTKWEQNGNWGYPFETGEIGLKTGFNFALGSFKGIDMVNKNLITDIDIGFEKNLIFSYQSQDLTPLISLMPSTYSSNQRNIYEGLLRNQKSNFFTVGYGLGAGITYHLPVEDLHFRASYLFTPALSISLLDVPRSEYSPIPGDTERLDVDMDNIFSLTLFHQLKLNFLAYFGYVGLTVNSQILPIRSSQTWLHSYEEDDLGSLSFQGEWSRTFETSYKLSNITFDIGINF
jgi:hypothetical protein